MRRGRILETASVLALLALLATASSASALRTYSEPIEATSTDIEAGKVKCEEGERVVSGGFTGFVGEYALVNKAVRGKAWLVKGEFSPGAEAFANCSPRLKPEEAKATKDFDEVRASATAKCKKGEAVAGGWAFKPLLPNSDVFTSRPSFNRWKTGAFSEAKGIDRITSFAYCLRKDAVVHQTTSVLPSNGSTSTPASCDPGAELLGGGFETLPEPDFSGTTGPDPAIYGFGRTDQIEWTVEGQNYSPIAGSLEGFAVCLP